MYTNAYSVLLDKVNEGSPLYLYHLSMSVIEGEDQVKEVTLAQVARRLLLEMSSSNGHTANITYD